MISPLGENTVLKSKMISRRMFLLSAAKAVVLFGIFGRLVSLQINESSKYRTLSDKNRFREWKLAPKRGTIKDFFDKEIATNEKVYQLHITPENTPKIGELFFRLQKILDLSDVRVAFLKKKMKKQKPWEPIIISDNLSWSEFSRVNLFLHELQGAEPIVSVARVYPNTSAAHIVGYVSKVSQKDLQNKEYLRDMSVTGISVGKTGLEHKLDESIIGKVGFQRYEVNAFGKRIKQIQIDHGKAGENYKVTIDLQVQELASDLIKDQAASVCVMSSQTYNLANSSCLGVICFSLRGLATTSSLFLCVCLAIAILCIIVEFLKRCKFKFKVDCFRATEIVFKIYRI
mgnify:CR=1 FL=1